MSSHYHPSPSLQEVLKVKHHGDVVFLGFKKAFDSISDPELLYTLLLLDITDPVLRWFKAYLSHRTRIMSIEES